MLSFVAVNIYGNSRLLFRLQIYRYDKDNGGVDYGNKKDNS